jgi:hypothetical protein
LQAGQGNGLSRSAQRQVGEEMNFDTEIVPGLDFTPAEAKRLQAASRKTNH